MCAPVALRADSQWVNTASREYHRRAAALTRGAYLPTNGNAPDFHVAVYDKPSRTYRILPGGFTSYAAAEDAAAELHVQVEDALDSLRRVTDHWDYKNSPLHGLRFVPMTAKTWRHSLTPNGNRRP